LRLSPYRDFLREPEQWPECHILLGAREGDNAAELLRELEREFPGGAHVQMLGEMDLSTESERRRLMSFLHGQPQLRAIENVDDARVLNLVGGYPRIISRWTADDARETVQTFDGLERLAQEANEFRYRDLEKLLLGLEGDCRTLAVRIVLIPPAEDADIWRAVRPIILAGLDPNALDDLKLANILESDTEAPKFGHPKRRDAARAFFDMRRREAVRTEAKGLIFALARSVTAIDASAFPYATALVGLRDEVRRQSLGSLPLALCEAALHISGERLPSSDSLIEGAREARRSSEPGVGTILAVALYDALHLATEEDDLARRDALLDELRALARAYPNDAAVRERLAMGLFNTLIYAKAEDDLTRRDALLDELRALARPYPDYAAVRKHLAMGLFNTLNDAKAENDLARRDALLDELRTLVRALRDDAAVRERLAMGMRNALNDAIAKDLVRPDPLPDELRARLGPMPMTPPCASRWPRACSTR
jgi:hypothetical protein